MASFYRPRIVISACLEFEACRYNGQMIKDPFVQKLKDYVDFLPVCPEMALGLGVPRDPIHIQEDKGVPILCQKKTGIDLTKAMEAFARNFLASLEEVDGFLLKGRSPSCGYRDVKLYRKGIPGGKGHGFFTRAVLETFPHTPLESEGRLKNGRIRDHFLTAIFTLASFRHQKMGPIRSLVQFQGENKLLFLGYNEELMRIMGRLVASHDGGSPHAIWEKYELHLKKLLKNPPGYRVMINVLMHAMGYFSTKITREEKAFLLNTFEQYRRGAVPLSVPLHLLKGLSTRFQEEYLLSQTFFSPYPQAFMEPLTPEKGRKGTS